MPWHANHVPQGTTQTLEYCDYETGRVAYVYLDVLGGALGSEFPDVILMVNYELP